MTHNKIHNGSNKTIIINSGVLYIRLGIVLFLSLFSTRYVLEGLGESNFGIYNLLAGIVALFGFISSTMAGITQRFLSYEIGASQDIERVKNVFNVSLRLHLFVAGIVALIVIVGGIWLINNILNIPEASVGQAKTVLYIITGGVFITIIGVPFEATLMAHENIKFVAIVQIGGAVMKFASSILLLVITSNKLIIFSLLMTLIPLVTVVCEAIYANKNYRETKFISVPIKNNMIRREMQNFAGLTLWGNMGWAIRNQGVSIFINIFFGVIVNAANGIANQVNGALMSLSSSMTTSIRPQLVQSAGERQFDRMISLGFNACKYPLLAISAIGIPLIISMPVVLEYWLKEVPSYAVIFCRLLIIELIINQSTYGIALILDAIGKIKSLHLLVGSSLIATTVIAYLVGKWFNSPTAIYLCLVGNSLVIFIIRIILVWKNVSKLGYYKVFKIKLINSVIIPLGFTLVLVSILFYIYKHLPQNYWGLMILLGFSVLLVLLITLIVFTDRLTLQKIINRFRNE